MGCIRSPQTDSDPDDVWLYVASESGSVAIADRLIDSITKQFLLLAQYPHIGRRRDEDLRAGLRSFPVRDYVIFYRMQDADVVILRVLHGSRDVGTQFSR